MEGGRPGVEWVMEELQEGWWVRRGERARRCGVTGESCR